MSQNEYCNQYKITNKQSGKWFVFIDELENRKTDSESERLGVLARAMRYYDTQPSSRIKTALQDRFNFWDVEIDNDLVQRKWIQDRHKEYYANTPNIVCLHCEGKAFIKGAIEVINNQHLFTEHLIKEILAVPELNADDVATIRITELETLFNRLKTVQ
jgi:hypothetical protein